VPSSLRAFEPWSSLWLEGHGRAWFEDVAYTDDRLRVEQKALLQSQIFIPRSANSRVFPRNGHSLIGQYCGIKRIEIAGIFHLPPSSYRFIHR
jgi:hypothetical protein